MESYEKILVVDDEPTMLVPMQFILADAGYHVFTASDGGEGLAVARKELPDIIITDNKMSPIDGLELVKDLRRDGVTVPIIVYSAIIHPNVEAQYKLQGVKTFLNKPVSMKELLDAVVQELGLGEQGSTETTET